MGKTLVQINKGYICRKFFHRIRFLRFSVSGSCETATNFFAPTTPILNNN